MLTLIHVILLILYLLYLLNLNLDSTTIIEYKFINGNTFTGEEIVPSTCGVSTGFGGYNRQLDIPEADTELDTVCFSACSNCLNQVPVNIEFRVNMSQQIISSDGVHIAGTFNGFDADSTAMTDIGGGIYSATISTTSGTSLDYKFINGNTFTGEEQVPANCGIPNGFGGYNRNLIVPQTNTTLNTICFSSCVDCVIPVYVNVAFRVNLSNETISPDGVHLAGTFNGFDADSTTMTAIGGGVYEAIVTLDTATTVSYKYINGNSFAGVESVPSGCGVADGFGGYNRQLSVPNVSDTLPTICFSSCSNCSTAFFSEVHFRVNMSNEIISPNGVHIAGTFNGFDADSTEMVSIGGGVYEAVFLLDTSAVVLYKYINGNTFATVENVPSGCGAPDGFGGFNRELAIPNTNLPTTLANVCFSACADCGTVPALADITFLVDLTGLILSPNGVHIAGTFNGFDADSTTMIALGSNVYAATLSLDTTTSIQWKYINGNSFGAGLDEVVPATCGVPNGFGGFNRNLNVPNANDTLDIVCFSSCSACIGIGLSELNSSDFDFVLAPTITSNDATVLYTSKVTSELTLTLSSVDGRMIQQQTIAAGLERGSILISTSTLKSGIYFVQLNSKQKRVSKKLVLIK